MSNRIYCKVDFTDSTVSGAAAFDSPTWTNNFSATNASELSKDTALPELLTAGGKYSRTMRYATKGSKYGIRGGVVNSQGKLPTDVSLTVKAKDNAFIDNITIYFDKANGQYATKYIIDGETRTNDDYELALTFSNRQSLTITFLEWNRVGYNAVIQYLGFDLDNKVFDKRWFKSIELTDQTMPIQAEPFFDVMSSQGNAQFNDLNGELRDYATDGILKPNLPFEIFVNDYKVANMQVSEWGDYEVQARQVQAYLVDKLAKLDNAFSGMPLTENMSAYTVLRTICVPTIFADNATFDNALQKVIVVGYGTNKTEKTIKAHLENINIQYAYLEKSTMREALKKVLQIAMLLMYVTASGAIFFDTARPRITAEQKANAIIIPPQAQMADWQETIQPKNEYKGIEVDEKRIEIKYKHTSEFNGLDNMTADSDDVFISTSVINKNQPNTYSQYNTQIITDNFSKQWLIGYFDDNALSKNIGYQKIIADTEPFCVMRYDKNKMEGGSYYTFANLQAFINYVKTQQYDKHIGGATSKNFNITNTYFFAIRLDSGNEFNIYWGATADIYYAEIQTKNQKYGTQPNYQLQSSELLQSDTKINNQSISEYLANATIDDYSTKNGIRTATVTLTGSVDYKNSKGDKVVIWNGDSTKPTILQKGDIVLPQSNKKDKNGNYLWQSVYKNGEPQYWEITGINHKYAGNNRLGVELREVFA